MRRETRNRLFWIVPVLAVHIGIAAMLVAGLTVSQVQEAVVSILVTDIEAPPPAPLEEEARAAPEPEGEDAPPDLVADAVPDASRARPQRANAIARGRGARPPRSRRLLAQALHSR
ncbi:MAG: hypothetical protein AAF205_01535, partial [Pseudomonadota bacterium]